jgi:hypothetical protein
MPFTETNTPPVTKPKVTVRFAGLMLLKPGDNNTCEIGIHKFSSTHMFQVMLIVSKPDRPPTLLRLFTGPLTAPFAISASAPGSGFQAFAATAAPFVRNDPNNHELDYRWALDLTSLHPNADFNDGARPVVTLNAGVLYTPTLTRSGLGLDLVQGNAKKPQHRVAADLAASIEVPSNNVVRLAWSDLGDPQTLDLPRSLDPEGTTYTISLMNDPPISSPAVHDELALYYKVLEVNGAPVPDVDRGRLNVKDAQKTDEIPCLPVTLNSRG